MAIKCGFFNSINKDRLYQANDMNKPYELLVSNGVFATPEGTPSNLLQVYANDDMGVTVSPGRGIFFDKWLVNDDDLYLPLDSSEVTLTRIDSVVVRIDINETVRAGDIYIKKGTPASTPSAPELERTNVVMEYRLANITINPGVSSITQSVISDRRGYADECGWVTSLIKQVDTSTLFAQFDTGFNEWFTSIKEFLATATLIRSYTSAYTTTVQDETVIPINITQFNYDLDILQVYINGLMLIRDYEYSSSNNDNIVLTHGVDPGTTVSFVVYKSIDGSKAETIIGQVETLQNLMPTALNGMTKHVIASGADVLDTFVSYGAGMHTMYAGYSITGFPAYSEYRCFGHLTDESTGWLLAVQYDGALYFNSLNTTWSGWVTLFDPSPNALYRSDSGVFPTADGNIIPTKTLAQCAHGWQLIWTAYDDENDVGLDTYTQVVNIPKKSYGGSNWNGESMTFPLVYSDTAFCVKTFTIYNDRIVSGANNGTGTARNMVLRAIYEY